MSCAFWSLLLLFLRVSFFILIGHLRALRIANSYRQPQHAAAALAATTTNCASVAPYINCLCICCGPAGRVWCCMDCRTMMAASSGQCCTGPAWWRWQCRECVTCSCTRAWQQRYSHYSCCIQLLSCLDCSAIRLMHIQPVPEQVKQQGMLTWLLAQECACALSAYQGQCVDSRPACVLLCLQVWRPTVSVYKCMAQLQCSCEDVAFYNHVNALQCPAC
jgi:hypothetical protein